MESGANTLYPKKFPSRREDRSKYVPPCKAPPRLPIHSQSKSGLFGGLQYVGAYDKGLGLRRRELGGRSRKVTENQRAKGGHYYVRMDPKQHWQQKIHL